jgi:REP element-mobilizing transposase RayT
MARPLRIDYEGAFQHITARGNEHKRIFISRVDYEKFLSLIKDALNKYGIILHCYVLMGNHYHLIVETPNGTLSRFMHDINSGYTTYFNIKRKRTGHLLHGRFKSILIDKNSYLLELSRYIHLNPLRAHMVEKLEEYPYSSYQAYIYSQKETMVSRNLIWGMVSPDRNHASEAYRRFVEEMLTQEPASPFEKVYGGIILGNKQFIKDALKRIKDESLSTHETSRRKLLTACPPELGEIITFLASHYGVSDEKVVTSFPYRHYAVYPARTHTPLSNVDIGKYFGIGVSAVTKIVTRLSNKIKTNEKIREELRVIREKLSLVNG